MSIFDAILLGLLQGLTEFIPVSSSGHLLLAHEVLGTSENTLSFDVALHVGTLIALLFYFRNDLIELLKNINKDTADGKLARLLILATIPALIAGLLFSDFIENNVRSPLFVAISLAAVAVVMLWADRFSSSNKKTKEVSTKQGVLIGIAQALALIPGVSRSGSTITAGILLGLNRQQAARFSFLLAIPIVAGSALGILLKGQEFSSSEVLPLIFGVIAALLSGLFAIKFMMESISRLGLKPFAIYRILLAAVVLVTLV